MRALTSQDTDEIVACIKQLKATHAGTGFMHETFNVNDPANFTRSWFGAAPCERHGATRMMGGSEGPYAPIAVVQTSLANGGQGCRLERFTF